MRARASPTSSRLPRRRSWWRVGGTTRARHEDARAKRTFRGDQISRGDRARRSRARRGRASAGRADREARAGRGRKARAIKCADRLAREGVCLARSGRIRRFAATIDDASLSKRFPRDNVAPGRRQVLDAVADENALFFSKATALCEAHDPKSHAPGVSSRPRHRAHRRAGKTHERSKGESSDMPPRGMSAEVRALSSAPLRRGAQIREMRAETRATRGA